MTMHESDRHEIERLLLEMEIEKEFADEIASLKADLYLERKRRDEEIERIRSDARREKEAALTALDSAKELAVQNAIDVARCQALLRFNDPAAAAWVDNMEGESPEEIADELKGRGSWFSRGLSAGLTPKAAAEAARHWTPRAGSHPQCADEVIDRLSRDKSNWISAPEPHAQVNPFAALGQDGPTVVSSAAKLSGSLREALGEQAIGGNLWRTVHLDD
ncbi:MAG: hypothetical protein QM809_16130 [Gordonia sp. (in: high G+C Gram-positive bacteria)]|uniref:hypothetical protein n=1 Tax=Gordonia sp. (in: high G+C Gram-positive bacteria) TaxID=84139 RepID=UPI0039E28C73